MVSLIGNTDAFTSFSFGQPTTPSAPAPIPNTGQTFVGGGGTDPVFTDPAPQNGISAEQLARIAFKDEANTFTKEQKIGIYEVGKTLDSHQDDIEDNKQKLTQIENTTEGLKVNSNIITSNVLITDTPTNINVKNNLSDKENRLKAIEDDLSTGSTFNKIDTLQTTAVTLADADTALGNRITPIETSLNAGGTIRNLIDTNKTELQESINLINENLSSGTTFTKIKNIEDDLSSGTTFNKISNLEGQVTNLNDKTDKLEISGDNLLFKIKGDFEEGLISRKVSTFNDLQFINTEGNLQNLKTSIKNLETATASTPESVNNLIAAHQVTTDLATLTNNVQNAIDVCSDIKRVDGATHLPADKKLEIDDQVLFKKQITISPDNNINANGRIRLFGMPSKIQFAGGGGIMFGNNPESPLFEVFATQLQNMMEGIQTVSDAGPELNVSNELDTTGENLKIDMTANSFEVGCPSIFNHTIYLNIKTEVSGPQAKLRSKFKNFYINDSREMREKDGGTGKKQFNNHITKMFFQTEFAQLRSDMALFKAKFKKIQFRDLEDAGGNFLVTGTPPSGHSEMVIGIRDNELEAGQERFHTTRFLGNVLIGRGTDFHEAGAADNTEYNLRDFIENINTTIDNRVSAVSTTINGESIHGLVTRILSRQNVIEYDVTSKFSGNFINTALQETPVRGHFKDYTSTGKLEFIFALFDDGDPSDPTNTHLKFVGVELNDDATLSFHRFIPNSAKHFFVGAGSSILTAMPTDWDEMSPFMDTFVLKYYSLAPNTVPLANGQSPPNGYGLLPLENAVPDITAVRNDMKTRLDNIYTKSESDLRYVNGDSFYLKTDADAKFATISNVYTKTESDSTFTTNTDFVSYKNTNDADIISINGEIGNNSATGTIKGRIQKNQNDLNTLTSRVAVNESDISSLETRADGFQTKFTTNDANITNINNDIADLENKTSDITTTTSLVTVSKNTKFTGGVDLGSGQVLHSFGGGGQEDVIDKIKNLEQNSIFKMPDSNVGKELRIDDVRVDIGGGTYEKVLTSSRVAELLENAIDPTTGQVSAGVIPTISTSFFVPQSPFPIVYVTKQGQLASATLDDSVWEDNVYGNPNRGIDALGASDDLEKRWNSGLVPKYEQRNPATNERISSSIHLLTSEGTWRKLSDIFVDINETSTVSVSEHLPDFTPITANNKFAMTSMVNGGTIVYNNIDTSFVPEHSNNLYHTPERVNTLISNKLADGSLTTGVIEQLESQTLTAVSDRRLKTKIKPLQENINKLNPVEFEYLNDKGKKRYGFIAQEVKETHPELVETDSKGYLSVKYLDIIAMLVKQNLELTQRIENLEKIK